MKAIRLLLSDVGGVLLTNGWDTAARRRACLFFELDEKEFESRHNLYFPIHELGNITLDDYVRGAVFYRKRPFGVAEFIEFMKQQSKPLPGMIDLLKAAKEHSGLPLYALSNEGAELAAFRAKKFMLRRLFDAYLVSSFVHLRKPDPAFYRMALDLAQVSADEVLYLDDRPALVEAAAALGMQAFQHSDIADTERFLADKLKRPLPLVR